MWERFRQFIKPPVFTDLEKSRYAQNLHTILLTLLAVFTIYSFYPILAQDAPQVVTVALIFAIFFGIFILLQRGHVTLAGGLLTTILWIAVVSAMAFFGGIRNSGFTTIIVVVIIAGLTLGVRAGIVYAIQSILAATGLALAERSGWLPEYAFEPTITILVSHSLTILVVSLLIYIAIRNITSVNLRIGESERLQRETNVQLEAQRTELEAHTAQLEQRNLALQAVAEFSRLSAQVRDEQEVLDRASAFIAERFQLEAVGVYLLDALQETALLRSKAGRSDPAGAGSSNLKVTRLQRFGLSLAGSEYLFFNAGEHTYNIQPPDLLPGLAGATNLPMVAGQSLLGMINIQSGMDHPSPETISAIQTLADLTAVSLDNIRLFGQLQVQVRETNLLTGQAIQDAWVQISGDHPLGYAYDRIRVAPLGEDLPADVLTQIQAGRSAQFSASGGNAGARLVSPVVVRGESIGLIGYEAADPGHRWTPDEIALLETVSARVGLALENNRLLMEAERRAERERSVGRITAHMRETLDFETILRTAIQEIHESFDLAEAEVRLQPTANQPEQQA
ncbi:MAG: GAF domain-containing protein [Chloroflexi bacterium]|nr:GAF domain-containing protein [Chloroflexota bacterium]